jgi:PadR family transcriptional regulator PadR
MPPTDRTTLRPALLANLRRGVLEYCVLASLETEDRYGYELLTSLGALLESEGTIYSLLGRLRHDGLVETTWQDSPSGAPRRYHRLTVDGRDALVIFRTEWRSFSAAVNRIMYATEEQ